MTAPGPRLRCVVVGGAGAVGRMLVQLLLDADAEVCVVDSTPPEQTACHCSFECADITAIGPGLEAKLRRADVVLLAVPEQVALAAVPGVASALKPGALLADTLSVKSAIVAQLEAHAGHLEAVSLNPMFAPSLGIDGRGVAAVIVHDGRRTQQLLAILRERGGRIVVLSAQQHDEMTAVTQALTHAAVLSFGLALDDLDIDVDCLGQLAPPPHLTLLAMLARIAGGQPATYWDVQAANPYAARTRTALASAVRRLADAVDNGDEADFGSLLARMRALLGGDADHYGDLCEVVFATARPPVRADESRLVTIRHNSTERPST